MTFYIHHYLSGLIMYNVLCNNVLYSITTTSWNKWKICFTCCFRMFFSCLVLCFTSSCCSFSSFGIFWLSLVSPEFASLCCVSSLCLLLFPVFSSLTFPPVLFTSSRLCFLCYFDLFWVYFCIFFYSFGKKAKLYFKIEFLDFPSLTRGAWPIQCGPLNDSAEHENSRKEIFISTFQ